ncbi:MAG: 1-(5-phosphoribosyl)-5-((5-phosphoribosylamino)methylideneamino)imidazole-4-carboxamide isomerase, partial [Armatimonadetes bacterium]|nr:1-(5-phosphoribosyl)-5-((5-phosphoribosylamino)methylideneamino)imidazole-4-carboxamide isomerase [Anaerolineae bacterium]
GAARVLLGTLAIQQPELLPELILHYGVDQVGVALDARDGKLTTHGWQQTTPLTPLGFGRDMAKAGVRHALYTDIHRDGSLIGVNLEETIRLGRETHLQIIASGGISTAHEIAQLAHSGVVAGAVIGMALYEGHITLPEALLAAGSGDVG